MAGILIFSDDGCYVDRKIHCFSFSNILFVNVLLMLLLLKCINKSLPLVISVKIMFRECYRDTRTNCNVHRRQIKSIFLLLKIITVVPAMNGHPRDQVKVSVHDRWPLIRGTGGQVKDATYNTPRLSLPAIFILNACIVIIMYAIVIKPKIDAT